MTRRPAPLRIDATHRDATAYEAQRAAAAAARARRDVQYRQARGIPDPPPAPAPSPQPSRAPVVKRVPAKTPPAPRAVAPAASRTRGGRSPRPPAQSSQPSPAPSGRTAPDGGVVLSREEWRRVERLIDHTVRQAEDENVIPKTLPKVNRDPSKPNPRNGWRR